MSGPFDGLKGILSLEVIAALETEIDVNPEEDDGTNLTAYLPLTGGTLSGGLTINATTTLGGPISQTPDVNVSNTFGRLLMDSRVDDLAGISHVDQTFNHQYMIEQTNTGVTTVRGDSLFLAKGSTEVIEVGIGVMKPVGNDRIIDLGADGNSFRDVYLKDRLYMDKDDETFIQSLFANNISMDTGGTTMAQFSWNSGGGDVSVLFGDSSPGRVTGATTLLIKTDTQSSSIVIDDTTGVTTYDHTITCTGALELGGDFEHTGTNFGAYSTTPIAQQTGVAVTDVAIHAACVALGLFTA